MRSLFEINLHRGTRVRELSAKDIENIYDVRSTLDSLALRLTISNLQKEGFPELEDLLSQMKSAIEKKDLNQYQELNSKFHGFFYRKSANGWLSSIINGLMNHIMRLRSFSISTSTRFAQSYREHLHIVDAVRKKNAETAEALTKQYTKEAGKFVVHMFLEKNQKSQ